TAANQLPVNTNINIENDVPGLPQQNFPALSININDSYAGDSDGILRFPAPMQSANNERTTTQSDAWGTSGSGAAGSDTTTTATTTTAAAGNDWNPGGNTTTSTGAGSDSGTSGTPPGAPPAGSDGGYPAPPPIATPSAAEQQVINNLQAAVTAATAGNSQLSQTDMSLVGSDLQNMGYTLGNPLANMGNLTADQTSNVINQLGLNQTDTQDPSGSNPTQLAYDARLFSHDEQANGAINNTNGVGPSGEILAQTLLNGANNGQGSTFQPDQTQNQWLMQALAWSMDPNTNQINGSFLADSMGLTYDQA